MRILVVGSGGREHALAAALAKSPMVEKVFAAPGNSGTAEVAENVDIAADDIPALVEFAKNAGIGLVVPGPELPLTLGISEQMEACGIPCFGPDSFAAQLEGSKSFAKKIMAAVGVPTAQASVFDDPQDARDHAREHGAPMVIKADGLAAGKGVVVADTLAEAIAAIDSLSGLGGKILIEDKLDGEEVSILCLCDGETAVPLPSAQDHKAVFDGGKGPNTGGMGAYSPAPIVPDEKLESLADIVCRPILAELGKLGHPFKGVLYAGLMMTGNGPKVLEYNVRFGDPECQAILPRLTSDLAAHLLAAAKGDISNEKIEFSPDSCVDIVLAAEGYPGAYPRELPVEGLDKAEQDEGVKVFHAGLHDKDGRLFSRGGRVLSVAALGATLEDAQKRAYSAIKKIRMPRSHYRSDIADKGIKHLEESADMKK